MICRFLVYQQNINIVGEKISNYWNFNLIMFLLHITTIIENTIA